MAQSREGKHMRKTPMPSEIYQHFKGNIYEIITIAKHSETLEEQVVYRNIDAPYDTYVRPLNMFMEKVDQQKYPDVTQTYRFELMTEEEEEIHPLLLQFLDEDTYKGKLEVLALMGEVVNQQMLSSMAIATDVVLESGELQERFEEFKSCLHTLERYECTR